MTKRNKQRCKNPAAYGCKACRMHGAHKSRNVICGADHPQFKDGQRTKESEAAYQRMSTVLLTLRDIGDHLGMFKGAHTRGRKPLGYEKFSLKDSTQLILAIIKNAKASD